MSNPGTPLEYRGRTMLVTEWARLIGIKPVTLHARLRKGWSIERCMTPESLRPKEPIYYKKVGTGQQESQYKHRLMAEKAIGRPLPRSAEVHHVDGNPKNNEPGNLVICQDHAYHRLLHMRTEALEATGNANARKCAFCKQWDAVENLTITKQNRAQHRVCYNAAMIVRRTIRKANQSPEMAFDKED